MARCARCFKGWGGNKTNHCPVCHQTFSTMNNGDKHRVGDENEGTRKCVDPSKVGLRMNDYGYWVLPNEDPKRLENLRRLNNPGLRLVKDDE